MDTMFDKLDQNTRGASLGGRVKSKITETAVEYVVTEMRLAMGEEGALDYKEVWLTIYENRDGRKHFGISGTYDIETMEEIVGFIKTL